MVRLCAGYCTYIFVCRCTWTLTQIQIDPYHSVRYYLKVLGFTVAVFLLSNIVDPLFG